MTKDAIKETQYTPYISVIVPVYNVQEYLDECIQSIISQTYSNLEIILVDDGSTDNSGKICDEWRERDSRIKVIHKENGGQADARNIGLAYAQGDYIGFIDSDDIVSPVMYEILIKLCTTYKVPLSCARFDIFGEENNMVIKPDTGIEEKLSAHEMLKIIIWRQASEKRFASFSVWDRLYKKDLIQDLKFPKGMVYEDIPFSIQSILRAKECAYINKSLYHYRIRKTSTTGKDDGLKNKRWISDKYPIEKEQIEYLKRSGHNDLAVMQKYVTYQDLLLLKRECPEDKEKIISALKDLDFSINEVVCYIPGPILKMKAIIKLLKNKIEIYRATKQ